MASLPPALVGAIVSRPCHRSYMLSGKHRCGLIIVERERYVTPYVADDLSDLAQEAESDVYDASRLVDVKTYVRPIRLSRYLRGWMMPIGPKGEKRPANVIGNAWIA